MVGTIVLVVAGGAGASENTAGPPTRVDALKLVLGALLVLMAGPPMARPSAR